MIHVYVALGLFLLAGGVGFMGRRQSSKADVYGLYVEATRPSELAPGVPGFYGGTVTTLPGQPPLVAPYSKQPCVWYAFTLEQEVVRHEANGSEYRDWQSLSAADPQGVLFGLQATGGIVQVNPLNAQVHKPQQYESFIEPELAQAGGLVGGLLSAARALSGSRVRVCEQYIPLGQQLYAGGLTLDQSGQKVFIHDQAYPLVLSAEPQVDLVRTGRRTSLMLYTAGLVLFGAAIVTLLVAKG
jgi:hypothetical protein